MSKTGITDLPKFYVNNNHHTFYFVKLDHDFIIAWEEMYTNNLIGRFLFTTDVKGGKPELERLNIWDKIPAKTQETILNNNTPVIHSSKCETMEAPKPISNEPKRRGRPPKVQSSITPSTAPIIKRGRGRPRKNPLLITPTPQISEISIDTPKNI
jgi:hypothetical protein